MRSFRPPSLDNPDRFKLADHDGQLALFAVHGIEPGVSTAYGPKDAARVDVLVLTGDHAGTTYQDQLIFATVVRQQLEEAVEESDDNEVLARIGTGTAKAGQSPPWVLQEPTDADEKAAQEALASQARREPRKASRSSGWSARAPF